MNSLHWDKDKRFALCFPPYTFLELSGERHRQNLEKVEREVPCGVHH